MSSLENDIVIVSSGAVLPGAENSEEFFSGILEGKTQVHDLRFAQDLSYRPLYDLTQDSDRTLPDTSYSAMGADIPRERIRAIAHRHGLDLTTSIPLHVMITEAVHQCLHEQLNQESLTKTDFIFSSPDALATSGAAQLMKVLTEIQDQCATSLSSTNQNVLKSLLQTERDRLAPDRNRLPSTELSIPSHISEKIRERFGFGGAAFLIDAACASSVATFYLAKLRLQQGLCRYAIVGGADDSLGACGTLAAFSKIGVLSDKVPQPFDWQSEGIALGEGAVAFLVTTLGQALRDGREILGVIKGIGGSSDGKPGGLTEPTVAGQTRCYENAYSSFRPEMMNYLECHGTGTKVGDQTELSSLMQYFGGSKIPVGSAKYNVGHTMTAAGAVSVLKGLGILKHKKIPPSPYFKKFHSQLSADLFLNTEILPLPEQATPINIGISSFGFGGTNFHLWLQEYKPAAAALGALVQPQVKPHKPIVVLCGQSEASIEQVPELFSSTSYNLPPKTWSSIDRVQLLSVLLAEKIFREAGIAPQTLESDRVHIISGAGQSLSLAREMTRRCMHRYGYRLLKKGLPESEKQLHENYLRAVEDSPELNEQSAIGSINNLIASRVSKAFDFRGLNFNIDGDQSAGLQAIEVARNLLCESSGAAIVVDTIKKFDQDGRFLKTIGMRCFLMATNDFAEKHNLPILGQIGAMTAERSRNAV